MKFYRLWPHFNSKSQSFGAWCFLVSLCVLRLVKVLYFEQKFAVDSQVLVPLSQRMQCFDWRTGNEPDHFLFPAGQGQFINDVMIQVLMNFYSHTPKYRRICSISRSHNNRSRCRCIPELVCFWEFKFRALNLACRFLQPLCLCLLIEI